jgi:hypothetical protein
MKLNAQHHQAITLLSEGLTNKSVAEKLDVAQETVSRWKADYDFQAELNKVLNANHASSQEKLRHLSSIALSTIEAVLLDDEPPPRDKVTAAFKVLEITRFRQGNIGSTNPAALEKQAQDDKLLDSYGF